MANTLQQQTKLLTDGNFNARVQQAVINVAVNVYSGVTAIPANWTTGQKTWVKALVYSLLSNDYILLPFVTQTVRALVATQPIDNNTDDTTLTNAVTSWFVTLASNYNA
jgi:hypothetical protein